MPDDSPRSRPWKWLLDRYLVLDDQIIDDALHCLESATVRFPSWPQTRH